MYEVLRPFEGPAGRLAVGEIVEAREWRNTAALVRQRYLRLLPPPEKKREKP